MRVPLPRQMQVLYNRNFRLYWLGQLVSLTGTWMQGVAQGWVLLEVLGKSVAALGIVNFAMSAPSLLLMLHGGVVADRWERRKVMIVTQLVLAVLALVMGLMLAGGSLTYGLLLAVTVLMGVAVAFDMPVQQAMTPDLVAPQEIPQAIAMNQVIFNGSRLLGPGVAGAALALLSLPALYFLNALSFLAVIASLVLIRLPAGHGRGGAHGSMWESLREGLGYVARERMLRQLFLVMALSVMFVFPAMAVLPAGYVKEELDMGPGTIGFLMAVSGGASMLGAFAMLWVPVRRRGLVMAGGVVLAAAAMATMAGFPNVWVAAVATGSISVGFSLFAGLNATTVQQIVPGHLRGRVMSISGLMFSGVMPFAGLIVSFAVDGAGFGPVYAVCAALYLLTALPLLFSSGIMGFVPPAQPDPGHAHAHPQPAAAAAGAVR